MDILARKPRKGERVGIKSHGGEFNVIAVGKTAMFADLELMHNTGPKYVEKNVPWTALIYLEPPREDFSQAAARIVGEATERS